MSDPMHPRILHVAETCVGGVASYFQEIVSYQTEALGADNVRVLVPRDHAGELVGVDEQLICSYPRTGRNLRSLLSFSVALASTLRRFQPSIVHMHSTFAGAVARPIVQLSRPRPRVVYCPHGWAFLMEIPEWKRRAYALIERLLCPLTDVVVNISRYEHEQAKAYGISAEKCVVVRNAVSPGCAAGLADPPFDDRFINLLFVGRFDRQKGLDLLLQVMGRLKDTPIRLHVIGSCVVEEQTVRAPDTVNLLGWLPRSQLDAYYSAADGVVMPSRWEGFGLVAIEAMRNGTPVIASNRGALPELVQHGKTGYVFDLNEQDLSSLERTLRGLDKQRLREMGAAAAQHFRNYFTADGMNRSLLEIYGKLHRAPAHGRPHLELSGSNL